jgi:hypothetical protein
MEGWRFVELALASTDFEALFRRDGGREARLRFIRPDPRFAWRSFPGVDATLIAGADGRLPEPAPPYEFLAAWLDGQLAGSPAVWPEWNPDPPPLVVVSGIPRSGTAWAKRIVRSLVESTGHSLAEPDQPEDATLDRFGSLAEHRSAVRHVCEAHRRDPLRVRLIKAHYFSGAAFTAGPAFRVLFLYRDLRDVLVSQLDRALHGPGREHFNGLSPDATFARLVELSVPIAVAALERVAAGVPETTLLVRYERLLEDRPAQVQRIARFLGIALPEDLLALLVETHGFRKEAGRNPGRTSSGDYHRRGVSGSWRDQLTTQQLEIIANAVPDLEGLLARVDQRCESCVASRESSGGHRKSHVRRSGSRARRAAVAPGTRRPQSP